MIGLAPGGEGIRAVTWGTTPSGPAGAQSGLEPVPVDQRLQDMVDADDIVGVAVRYASALDSRDWERLRTCFVPDAVAVYEGIGRLEGVAAIERACQASLGPLDASQHFVSNFESDVQGDRAAASCYLQAQHVRRGTPGGDLFTVAGIYVDTLARTSEGWRIVTRELRRLWTAGNPDVLGHRARDAADGPPPA